MSSQHNGHYVKLRAKGTTVSDILICDIIGNTVNAHSSIDPIALSTSGSEKLQNITTDFCNKITMPDVYKDNGVSGLVISGCNAEDDNNDNNNVALL